MRTYRVIDNHLGADQFVKANSYQQAAEKAGKDYDDEDIFVQEMRYCRSCREYTDVSYPACSYCGHKSGSS